MEIEEAMARAMQDRYERESPWKGDGTTWDELEEHTRQGWLEDARAALRALSEQGYAVVPVEPTEAMVAAAMDEWHEDRNTVYLHVLMRDCWRAMLDAAGGD